MCHMSHVTCHMSFVICHIFFPFFSGQFDEAYRWRVCYQRGLPRLVFYWEQSIFNRPGVAGAVLQSHLILIQLLIEGTFPHKEISLAISASNTKETLQQEKVC